MKFHNLPLLFYLLTLPLHQDPSYYLYCLGMVLWKLSKVLSGCEEALNGENIRVPQSIRALTARLEELGISLERCSCFPAAAVRPGYKTPSERAAGRLLPASSADFATRVLPTRRLVLLAVGQSD